MTDGPGRRPSAVRADPPVVAARVSAPAHKGILRLRLVHRLERLSDHRLGLVVAPAGSGKTTLLGQYAARAAGPVAWYRAEGGDGAASTLLAHLHRAVTGAVGQVPVGWRSVQEAARAFEATPLDGLLLVVDDLHLLLGTEAEAALEQLIDVLPESVKVLAASRCPPAFNLSRLRVSEALLELGPDDLRFRSWEVEQLFAGYYRAPLPPQDLAELARRTEGWAAGLQLFHLATRDKPPGERRRLLAALGSGATLVREYLARNVLDELGESVRDFLVRTSVLGRLDGPLCDRLLGRTGSEQVLTDLERRQVFTIALDGGGGYRYHEALRTHLEALLLERLGAEATRAAYRRAGQLLEQAGSVAEALRAYCCADDGEAAARLLGREGQQLVDDQGSWLDRLPPALVAADRWLQLASARRCLADGRPRDAVEIYQRAQAAFGREPGEDICRRERLALAAWLEPRAVPAGDWSGLARAATQRDPLGVLRRSADLTGATGAFVRAIGACLAGRPRQSRSLALAAVEQAEASPTLFAAAGLLAALAPALVGSELNRLEVAAWAERAELLGIPWLNRLSAASAGIGEAESAAAGALRAACTRAGDDWGASVIALLQGLGTVGPTALEALGEAADGFAGLGAGVLEAWSRAHLALALARAGRPEAGHQARSAETLARATATHGALAVAYAAQSMAVPTRAQHFRALAASVAQAHLVEVSPSILGPGSVESPAAPPPPASVTLRCFGRFALGRDGVQVDLSGVKPKARSLLRLLAMHAGRPVHREQLIDALWPGSDPAAATRCLQVAVSSLRRALDPDGGRAPLLVRDGDAYRLAVPTGADVDLTSFERPLAQGRASRAAGDPQAAAACLRAALEAYAGELLPEEGPAEWVVKERDRYRMEAADAAANLAELLLELDEPEEAAVTCERGIRLDRYRDELWRLLVEASRRAGNVAAGSRAQAGYDAMLADLGLR